MKNTFFILAAVVMMSFSAQAQKKKAEPVKPTSVPENVTNSFKSQFMVANDNHWNKNYSGNYVASFRNAENLKQTVEYSASGSLIKSKVEYAVDALPENLSAPVAAQYPNLKITEASKLQLPGVAPYYKIKIQNTDNTSKELLVSEEGVISE